MALYQQQSGQTFPSDMPLLSQLYQMITGPSLLWLQDENINSLVRPTVSESFLRFVFNCDLIFLLYVSFPSVDVMAW